MDSSDFYIKNQPMFDAPQQKENLQIQETIVLASVDRSFIGIFIQSDFVLSVTSPCGSKWEWNLNEAALPRQDIPCSCGDPKHWFLKYGKND